jgi:hypothetical protein
MVAQTSLAHIIPLAKRYVQIPLAKRHVHGAAGPADVPRSGAWIRQIAPVRQLLGAFTGVADFELQSPRLGAGTQASRQWQWLRRHLPTSTLKGRSMLAFPSHSKTDHYLVA